MSIAEVSHSSYTSFADMLAGQHGVEQMKSFLDSDDEESPTDEQLEITTDIHLNTIDLSMDDDDLLDDISIHSAQSLTMLNLPPSQGYASEDESKIIPISSKVSRTLDWVYQQLSSTLGGNSTSALARDLTEEELAMSWGPPPIDDASDSGWSSYYESDLSSDVESSTSSSVTSSSISRSSSEGGSSAGLSTPPSSIGRSSTSFKLDRPGPLPARKRKAAEALKRKQRLSAEQLERSSLLSYPYPGALNHRRPSWIESRLPESLQLTKKRLEKAQHYHERALQMWAEGTTAYSWENIERWESSMKSAVNSYFSTKSVVSLLEDVAVAQLEVRGPKGGAARQLKSMAASS